MKAILFITTYCIIQLSFGQEKIKAKIDSLIQEGAYEIALEEAQNLNGNTAENNYIVSRIYHQLKDYNKAIDKAEKAVSLRNNTAKYHYLLGRVNLDALQVETNLYNKGMMAFAAKGALEKALEIEPEHIDARISLANYYLNAPIIAGGSSNSALKHALILKEYQAQKGLQLMGSIHLKEERFQEAIKCYKEILTLDSVPENSYYLIAVAFDKQNDFKEALKWSEKSISTFPNYLSAYYEYAKSAIQINSELKTAEAHLQYFIANANASSFPKMHWIHYRLGEIYLKQNQNAQAKTALEKSLKEKSDFQLAKDALKNLDD